MQFSHNAIFGGYRRYTKNERTYLFVTLLVEGMGSVDFFAPSDLESLLSTLAFGSAYEFDFRVRIFKGKCSIYIDGVH